MIFDSIKYFIQCVPKPGGRIPLSIIGPFNSTEEAEDYIKEEIPKQCSGEHHVLMCDGSR